MTDTDKPKGFKEEFSKFFEAPSREALREVLRNYTGEYEHLDFKESWIADDALARHVLAIANTGGGCIVFGVENETGHPNGLIDVKDESEWRNGAKKCLPTTLMSNIEFVTFKYEASEYQLIQGKCFQVLFVPDTPTQIPLMACAEGASIRNNVVYLREGYKSEAASYEKLQKLIERRLTYAYSLTTELELQDHVTQLRVLYKQISKTISRARQNSLASTVARVGDYCRHSFGYEEIPNPDYPEEDFNEFIKRAIELKKSRILNEIGAIVGK